MLLGVTHLVQFIVECCNFILFFQLKYCLHDESHSKVKFKVYLEQKRAFSRINYPMF
jgi:hypothetical protein